MACNGLADPGRLSTTTSYACDRGRPWWSIGAHLQGGKSEGPQYSIPGSRFHWITACEQDVFAKILCKVEKAGDIDPAHNTLPVYLRKRAFHRNSNTAWYKASQGLLQSNSDKNGSDHRDGWNCQHATQVSALQPFFWSSCFYSSRRGSRSFVFNFDFRINKGNGGDRWWY